MLNVVKSPNPLLNQVCEPCDLADKSLKKLSRQMARIMYANNGVGLAGPQVGILKRIVVIDLDWDEDNKDPLVLINPTIVETKGDPILGYEGCLSLPGISVPIKRAPWARVQYADLEGQMWEIEGDGLLARCCQHEIDHLNGVTLFESCAPKVRLAALRAYDQACAAGAKPGETAIQVQVDI